MKVTTRGGSTQKGGDIYIYLVASLVICGLFYKLETIKEEVQKLRTTVSSARNSSSRTDRRTKKLIKELEENKRSSDDKGENSGTIGTVITQGWRKRSKTPPPYRRNTRPRGQTTGYSTIRVARAKSPGGVAHCNRRRDKNNAKKKYKEALSRAADAKRKGRAPPQEVIDTIATYRPKNRGGKKTKKRKNTNKRRKNTRRRKKRAGHHPGWDF